MTEDFTITAKRDSTGAVSKTQTVSVAEGATEEVTVVIENPAPVVTINVTSGN